MPPKMKYPICLPIILASCALASLTNLSSAEDKKVYNLATVVKISGINWFNYMETGVKKFAQDTGNKTVQLGPPTTDSAQQIQIVEDLIAQSPDGWQAEWLRFRGKSLKDERLLGWADYYEKVQHDFERRFACAEH